jgi:hypothetical protein
VSTPDPSARIAPVLTRPAALSDVESSDNEMPATKVTKGGKKAAGPVEEEEEEEEEDEEEGGEDECANVYTASRRGR